MDTNSGSFQMFLFLLIVFYTAIGSESQISENQVTLYSSNVKGIVRYLLG